VTGLQIDAPLEIAARALAAGDPLGALNWIALRDDAPALALRGIAMARLGELGRAKDLLRSAARAFGARNALFRARCLVAEAEIALVSRDLNWSAKVLDSARSTLEEHGDRINAAYARYLEIRRLLLIGRLDEAEHMLADFDPSPFPPSLKTAYELVIAGIEIRRLRTGNALAALDRARSAARRAGIGALTYEVESAFLALQSPVARLIGGGGQRTLLLKDVEALLASKTLVVDACRQAVRHASTTVSLVRRPILFALARALGEAWPDDVARDTLVARAFRTKFADESHYVRLRVEIGRLRREIRTLARVSATKRGFVLVPNHADGIAVLVPPIEDEHAAVLACLGDGEQWSSSGLALALGVGQRTVQRSLDALASLGKVQSIGRGRSCRWTTTPVPEITTTLLLPVPLTLD
jgi:hypothetical protein